MLSIRIYSVGVWNSKVTRLPSKCRLLEFTPLEFETKNIIFKIKIIFKLEFTPLEFET